LAHFTFEFESAIIVPSQRGVVCYQRKTNY